MKTIEFFVRGIPAPAGSKRGFAIFKGPKGGKKEFTGKVAMVDAAGQRGKEWRVDVKNEARRVFTTMPLLTGPLKVSLHFAFARPKCHYGSGKNAQTLKPGAPLRHVTKPDVLKLARAVEDALTGIVWVDDSQITIENLSKAYGDYTGTGCAVSITELSNTIQ
jgi:Holliday junction resolvase RusA-like endonuclease